MGWHLTQKAVWLNGEGLGGHFKPQLTYFNSVTQIYKNQIITRMNVKVSQKKTKMVDWSCI